MTAVGYELVDIPDERLSERVRFGLDDKFLTIDGFKVSTNVLNEFTRVTPPGRWFRIINREDGLITIEQKQEEMA